MGCAYQESCGGCVMRHLELDEYQKAKEQKVLQILKSGLCVSDFTWEKPIFLPDGTRRRASFAFAFKKNMLLLGFNALKSKEITDCHQCMMLVPEINAILQPLRGFLQNFCRIKITEKGKGRKITQRSLTAGDVQVLKADNGLDVVLEGDQELSLDHRMEIFDFVNSHAEIIRFSYRNTKLEQAEPIIEKTKPIIEIGGYDVYVAPGMFLQASKAGEKTLVDTVLRYLGETKGFIADLFCGIGTFTYPLAARGNKVAAYDVNEDLLNGFRTSVHKQMLHQVEIFKQNLFKYPLEADQLKNFDVVVFDPPRAGAAAQVRQIAQINPEENRIKKIIAVSCNPHSFVNDANVLISAGYKLEKVVLVDQFVYSNHSELAALFTK